MAAARLAAGERPRIPWGAAARLAAAERLARLRRDAACRPCAESEDEARAWKPTVVHVDAQNRIVPLAGEVPGPQRRLRPV